MPKRTKEVIKQAEDILGPKWKIKIWTENDFDINSNGFTKYWYKKRQWAFVSDYIRAYAVYKEGGFYIDTDVILNKTLDAFTKYDYVASKTEVIWNTMSIFGAKKNHLFLKEYMDVISHPNMIKRPPRIMSTNIHSYVLNSHINIKPEIKSFFKDNNAILSENILQIQVDNSNVAKHEHHDNWKGTKTNKIKVSKYYDKKVEYFNVCNENTISKELKKQQKMNKKIKKLIS